MPTPPPSATLHFPWSTEQPAPGSCLDLRPDIKWVRMALPFALNHINLWLLRDRLNGRDGWTLVDCGLGDAPTRLAWEQVFTNELEGLPVLRVIVTHMHPDHIGLAAWQTARWSTPDHECRAWISATDFFAAHLALLSDSGVSGEQAAAHFSQHGLSDPLMLEQVRERRGYYGKLVPALPLAHCRLQDGLDIPIGGHSWRCLVGYGHAPEHISLHCAELGVLISGDMLLPKISTNISVNDSEPEANPLAAYLDSLDALRSLPPDTLVLPSHGHPFGGTLAANGHGGAHTRIDELHQHHAARLQETRLACTQAPQHAADLLPILFKRNLDLHQTTFALGESLAHLNYLWHAGALLRERDANRVWRYRAC